MRRGEKLATTSEDAGEIAGGNTRLRIFESNNLGVKSQNNCCDIYCQSCKKLRK